MASNLCKRKGRAEISFSRSQKDSPFSGRLLFPKAKFLPDEMSLDWFSVLDWVHGLILPYSFYTLRFLNRSDSFALTTVDPRI